MGVHEADLPDALQEVLLVVHRRLDAYDSRCRLSTWLFGICLRVAATTRRQRRRKREDAMDPEVQASALIETNTPERCLLASDARQQLTEVLEGLDPEKRAVFVMFEIEGIGCAEIADLLGVPKGTVFSRLSSARIAFLSRLQRMETGEQRRMTVLGVHQ